MAVFVLTIQLLRCKLLSRQVSLEFKAVIEDADVLIFLNDQDPEIARFRLVSLAEHWAEIARQFQPEKEHLESSIRAMEKALTMMRSAAGLETQKSFFGPNGHSE